RRLSLVKGSRRQSHRNDPRSEGQQSVKTVVYVVLPGCEPRTSPLSTRLHRQVQGEIRRRLRGLPRMGSSPHDRQGNSARRNTTYSTESLTRGCGESWRLRTALEDLECGREETLCQVSGGLRWLFGIHRRSDWQDYRISRAKRSARKHGRFVRG